MVEGLAILQELTTRLQAQQYVFGDLQRDFMKCESELTEKEQEHLPLQAALYMNPRFNNNRCALLTAEQKSRIVGYIGLVHKRMQDLEPRRIVAQTRPQQLRMARTRREKTVSARCCLKYLLL